MRNTALLCLLCGLSGTVLGVLLHERPGPSSVAAQDTISQEGPLLTKFNPSYAERLPAVEPELTSEELVNVAVYEQCNRSVVNINTKVSTEAFFFLEIPTEGAGSGCVLDQAGHVLTNAHVVEGAREIQVTLFDGTSYTATVVGSDTASDVCVLHIDAPAESLHPVTLGDSTRLKVGQRVFAIGNPFGLERTLTTGIISSLNRSLPAKNRRTMHSIIQIDAPLNPGNSGGPLLDSRGRLIGLNTAIASQTGQNAGVGFAIPASSIARVAPQLISMGRVVRPDVGIARVYQTERGLLVASLVSGGPAEAAGLSGPKVTRQRRRQGPFSYETQKIDVAAADLIVGVNGDTVRSADEFLSRIESHRPGEQVVLDVVRGGQQIRVPVRLGESAP